MPTGVVVFGGTGMLGAMVADVLARRSEFQLTATARTGELAAYARLPVAWQMGRRTCSTAGTTTTR